MRMRRRLLDQANRLLRRQRLFMARVDELTALADRFGSDKGTRFAGHGYKRHYSRLFERFREQRIIFLEVGLHRTEADRRRPGVGAEGRTEAVATQAPSLEMWRRFFPRARIFGFDIDDFSQVELDRCTILRGDMSSPDDLTRLLQAIGEPIDILIDDASHVSHHQQIALAHLFPHIRPGGMYIIEDLIWQDKAFERAGVPKTRSLMRELQVGGAIESPVMSREQRRAIEEGLRSVWLFDSLSEDFRGDPCDSLAVLVRK